MIRLFLTLISSYFALTGASLAQGLVGAPTDTHMGGRQENHVFTLPFDEATRRKIAWCGLVAVAVGCGIAGKSPTTSKNRTAITKWALFSCAALAITWRAGDCWVPGF